MGERRTVGIAIDGREDYQRWFMARMMLGPTMKRGRMRFNVLPIHCGGNGTMDLGLSTGGGRLGIESG